jgi:membrane fusion protein
MNASTTLFRPEVMRHRQGQWLGAIHLATPLSASVMTGVALVLSLLLILFLMFGHYTRKVRVAGSLEPVAGALKVVAAAGGILVERRVNEGDVVAEGDVLFVLSGERHSAAGATQALLAQQLSVRKTLLERERALRQAQGEVQQRAGLERAAAIDAELEQLRREAQLHATRTALARTQLQRLHQLAGQGFVSAMQAQQHEQELLEQEGRERALERSRLVLTREKNALLAQRDEAAVQAATDGAQLDRQLAALAAEEAEQSLRRGTVIRAAKAGVVSALSAMPGQPVAAGTVLATLVPRGAALEAHLYAASQAIGFVRPGQRVFIRYAAFPYQHYGLQRGQVREVSRTPSQPNPANLQSEPLYRLIVRLEAQQIDARGEHHGLKPGMALEADIAQEKRRLVEWFFAPLIAAKERIQA